MIEPGEVWKYQAMKSKEWYYWYRVPKDAQPPAYEMPTPPFQTLPEGYKTNTEYPSPPPGVIAHGSSGDHLTGRQKFVYIAIKQSGWHYWHKLPKGSVVELKQNLNRYKKGNENHQAALNSHLTKKFTTQQQDLSRTLFAVAMASGGSIPATTQAALQPLMAAAHDLDSGLLASEKFDLEKYCKSFAGSDKLRKDVIHTYAETIVQMRYKFKNKMVHIAHDKGNKKRFEHLIKALSIFDRESAEILTKIPDMNVTGDSGEDICDNLEASVNTVGGPELFKLFSQPTDNGGAGTVEECASKLIARGLVIKDMIVNNCDIH